MKRLIVQQGRILATCNREFIVETKGDDDLDAKHLIALGDDAEIEWTVDTDNAEVNVESSEVTELDPNEQYDCPEILYGGSVRVEAIELDDEDVELEDDDE